MVHDLQIRAPYLKREEGAVAKKCSNVPTGFTLSVTALSLTFKKWLEFIPNAMSH